MLKNHNKVLYFQFRHLSKITINYTKGKRRKSFFKQTGILSQAKSLYNEPNSHRKLSIIYDTDRFSAGWQKIIISYQF